MTILWHEMKRGKVSLWIWSLVIGFMLGICVLIYPEMASEMEIVSDIFSNMGSFSSAFGIGADSVFGAGFAFSTLVLILLSPLRYASISLIW